jgi:cytochrome c-type protein NapC
MLGVFVAGIVFWGGFNWSMEMTNTESFCISCHEMERNVYQEYKTSNHYSNPTGVRATCPECHVPQDWMHKVVRKIRASNELYHWAIGSIDTPEKFQAKRHELAEHVWASMRETDSRECRNCHEYDHMTLQNQTIMAKRTHELGVSLGNTCIDCHQGVSHTLPAEFDRELQSDALHKKIEQQEIACYECHEDLYNPVDDEEW